MDLALVTALAPLSQGAHPFLKATKSEDFCRLPIAPGWRSSFRREQNLDVAQVLDFVTLNDTLYWVKVVLGQRQELPSLPVISLHYGPRFSVQRFRDDQAALKSELKQIEIAQKPEEKKGFKGILDSVAGELAPEYRKTRERVVKLLKRIPLPETLPGI